jgi:hypothetical protein
MDLRFVFRVAALGCLFTAILSVGCCLQPGYYDPDIALRCLSTARADVVLELTAQKNSGNCSIDSMVFWSESNSEPLWAFRFCATPVSWKDLKTIIYGVLPSEPDPQQGEVKQVFPQAGKPRPIEAGEEFIVKVDYNYDSAFDSCGGHRYFRFEMGPDNSVKSRGTFELVEEPEKVKELVHALYGP